MSLSVLEFPKRVTLELTNRCNRKCAGCPRLDMVYPVGDMSITLLTNITKQLENNIVIVPFYRGEPTLHPQFVEAMKLLERFDTVQLATNGDLLTRADKKAILKTVSFFSLSFHKPVDVEALKFLCTARDHGVTTQLSVVKTELTDKKEFVNYWLTEVDRVRVYEKHSMNGFGNMGFESTTPCNKPFEEMVVYWDGKVGLCNHDWNNGFTLGDLNYQTIKEVWNGVPYQYVRDLHERGHRQVVFSCKDCSFEAGKVYGEIINGG